ncbi:response regulator transcription factor [Solemya velum gill symbiont]|uniref:response regulator transcription factor n=1 Tax=Solemya velum gill symbiont TaxID=2340 RepID=UPI000996F866|nr:response regulator transcription factor [Solemya velum gill symbiont]OOZ45196.1 DNA-binding response regulator [Solemya velum gill symbiont]OOZ46176.1 DNA-binding response regulator [Solemya velum gill symbiont]OOZ49623.1 DNA-binding response regulator [Solemya velum gill symbiont]OOZ51249.1 DNA-binding response regulator [Solemya velum gill symbiont]OOZ53794.1 DNA-binding response regulator [Solemya velum gill symbiont]
MSDSSDKKITGKVFVVDDDEAMRSSLRWLIESDGLEVETFESAQKFLESYYPGQAGCLLLDVRMPGMSGLKLQSQLEEREIRAPVIIITGHGDIAMAVKAMKAGARDFIEKPFDDEVLLKAIRRALVVDAAQRESRASQSAILARMAQLTRREQEVMEMVTSGLSNKEIASRLDVSAKTVEAHRARVMEKMEAGSLAELVRMAIICSGTTTPAVE